jgi:hypothetical protein
VNNSLNFWNKTQDERNPVKTEISNIMRKKKYMCTVDEMEACLKISRVYKTYRLRKIINSKVLKR